MENVVGYLKVIFVLIWCSLILHSIYFLFRERRRKAVKEIEKYKYTYLHYILGFSSLLVYSYGFRIEIASIDPFIEHSIALFGFFITVSGFCLTVVGRHNLGLYWNQDGTLQKEHVLINRGLYNYIRHPIYLGEALLAMGAGLFLLDIVVLIIFGVGVYLYNGYRIYEEEEYLHVSLDGYVEYCRDTPRLYPLSAMCFFFSGFMNLSSMKKYWGYLTFKPLSLFDLINNLPKNDKKKYNFFGSLFSAAIFLAISCQALVYVFSEYWNLKLWNQFLENLNIPVGPFSIPNAIIGMIWGGITIITLTIVWQLALSERPANGAETHWWHVYEDNFAKGAARGISRAPYFGVIFGTWYGGETTGFFLGLFLALLTNLMLAIYHYEILSEKDRKLTFYKTYPSAMKPRNAVITLSVFLALVILKLTNFIDIHFTLALSISISYLFFLWFNPFNLISLIDFYFRTLRRLKMLPERSLEIFSSSPLHYDELFLLSPKKIYDCLKIVLSNNFDRKGFMELFHVLNYTFSTQSGVEALYDQLKSEDKMFFIYDQIIRDDERQGVLIHLKSHLNKVNASSELLGLNEIIFQLNENKNPNELPGILRKLLPEINGLDRVPYINSILILTKSIIEISDVHEISDLINIIRYLPGPGSFPSDSAFGLLSKKTQKIKDLEESLQNLGAQKGYTEKWLATEIIKRKLNNVTDSLVILPVIPQKIISFYIKEITEFIEIQQKSLFLKADLSLELLSDRFLFSGNTVSILVELKNNGLSVAKNISVKCIGHPELHPVSIKIEKISSLPYRSLFGPLAFKFKPNTEGEVNIDFEISYDDNIMIGHRVYSRNVAILKRIKEEYKKISNPFIAGPVISERKWFIGRKTEIKGIVSSISRGKSGYILIEGQKRIGKTSLINMALKELSSIKIPSAIVNLHGLLFNEPSQFIEQFCKEIAIKKPIVDKYSTAKQEIDNWPDDISEILDASSRFFDRISKLYAPMPFIIAIDEFDYIYDVLHKEQASQLVNFFRALPQKYPFISMILVISMPKELLPSACQNLFMTCKKVIPLKKFSPKHTIKLLHDYFFHSGADYPFETEEENTLLTESNGHPYYLQLFAMELVDYMNRMQSSYIPTDKIVELIDITVDNYKSHFLNLLSYLEDEERHLLGFMAKMSGGFDAFALTNISDKRLEWSPNEFAEFFKKLERYGILFFQMRTELFEFSLPPFRRWLLNHKL